MTSDPREARPVTLPELPAWSTRKTAEHYGQAMTHYATAAVRADRASQSARIAALEAALVAYMSAQSRLLECWSERDNDGKTRLLQILHECEPAARAALAGDAP